MYLVIFFMPIAKVIPQVSSSLGFQFVSFVSVTYEDKSKIRSKSPILFQSGVISIHINYADKNLVTNS